MTDVEEPKSPDENAGAPTSTSAAKGETTPTGEQPDPIDQDTTAAVIDLDTIEADLDGVHAALGRLAEGTYWTDEITGEPIATEVLAADPLARRN